MRQFKFLNLLILLILSCAIQFCSQSSPTKPIDLSRYSDRWFNGFSIDNIDNFVLENPVGHISILGNGTKDSVMSYLYRSIDAENSAIADDNFNQIVFEYYFESDSTLCSVSSPANSDKLTYAGHYTLIVDGSMVTNVKAPNSGFSSLYMDTTIFVFDSSGDIDIKQHNGSCQVKTSKGNIAVEMIIKYNGFSRCFTTEGDIVLEIPNNSSATIYANSIEGIVSFNNLDILNLNESPGFLQGVLESGNGEIRLETMKGNIEINGI